MSAAVAGVVTPTAGRRLRGARPFLVLVLVLLACLLATTLLPGTDEDPRALSTTNTTDSGARALVQVMRARGIDVVAASGARDAVRRASEPDTTLVVVFPDHAADEVATALAGADRVVYIGTEQSYGDLLPGLTPDASGTQTDSGTPVAPGSSCTLSAPRRAGSVTRGVYGVHAGGDWEGCYDLGGGMYAYAERDTPTGSQVVIPDSRLVRNGWVAEFGNAALAINAIARTTHVVWYLPEYSDTLEDAPTPEPAWLLPALLLLCGAGLVAALARGRRLGRLVPEELPSHVPAAETVAGRGRLLRRSGDRAHAARALRADTARRLARRLAVPEGAPPEQLHAALVRAGVDPARAQVLLWGPPPTTDQALVDLAGELTRLEEDIRHD